jgi:hypothetical protein
MFALILSIVVCTLQVVTGFLLPGMFFHWCLSNRNGASHLNPGDTKEQVCFTRAQYMFQCLGFGSIYLTLQLLFQCAFLHMGTPVWAVVAVTLVIHLACSGLWWPNYRKFFVERWVWLSPAAWQTSSRVQLAIAILFGSAAVLLMPHGLDNSALAWVTVSLNDLQPFQHTQGATSYIGLVFIPSLLLKGIAPVPTIAAGLKILLSILLAAASRRLVEAIATMTHMPNKNRGWFAVILQLFALTTFFGIYGVYETGKETAFAILFLFVLAAELMAVRSFDDQLNWSAALPMAAAIGFGAMAIPYAFILTATFLCFSLGSMNLFRFSFCCVALSSPALIVSFHAMAEWSWIKSITIIVVPLFCFGLGDLFLRRMPPMRVVRLPGWIPYLLFGASLAAVAILLPIRFHLGLFPLDGKVGLIQLIANKNQFIMPGIAGILLFMFLPGIRRSAGSMAVLVFPFLALIPALVMAHWYSELRIPIHPQNVWDWAKDIPNWVSGIYFGVFGVFVLNTLFNLSGFSNEAGTISWLPSIAKWNFLKHPQRLAVCLVVIYLVTMNTNMILETTKAKGLPTYTSVGGHYDQQLAEFVEWAYLLQANNQHDKFVRKPILVAEDSTLIRHAGSLRLYGIRTITESETATRGIPTRNKYWCVATADRCDELLDSLGFTSRFSVTRELNLSDEVICRLDKIRHAEYRVSAVPLNWK